MREFTEQFGEANNFSEDGNRPLLNNHENFFKYLTKYEGLTDRLENVDVISSVVLNHKTKLLTVLLAHRHACDL